ncbi:tetratricopeptide repeat protein [Bradyrhizobium manausense]|uniref:tetratricopeptide repeat protein n=1 Tax=Bradyrhizobium manausense TaxID=989370 RepID=UPI001BA50C22|nr:tetratricopeptide repeat protein [Bradyrhizobium manausense]MBR1086985.1 tetratricopeptide repeat protein [Bradyrhizobium manausense]
MQIESEPPLVTPGQRLVPAPASSDWSTRILLLFVGAVILALMGYTFSDSAKRAFYALEEMSGLAPSQQQFATTYRQLGISALPPRLFAEDRVAGALTRLIHEKCDHQAIASLANVLAANGEQRLAASALMGFSLSCPGSEGEQATAGGLFLKVGDTEKALAVANALTSARPEIANFHYFRGKALVAAGRGAEAVNEYKSTIQLSPSPRQVGEWVFLELANLYASLDRPCDAVETIMSWIAIDPPSRNTARAQKLMETYGAQRCGPAPKSDSRSL